jgi:hypothetical protein
MLSDLRRLLENGPSRRKGDRTDVWFIDSGPIWRRFREWKPIKDLEIAVLSAVWQLPTPLFLLLSEDPPDPELAPFVRREGSAWRIETGSSPVSFYETESTSTLGGWCLYGSDRPMTAALPDVFRIGPDRVLAFMGEERVSVLVAAFHDSAPWCVALRDPDLDGHAG